MSLGLDPMTFTLLVVGTGIGGAVAAAAIALGMASSGREKHLRAALAAYQERVEQLQRKLEEAEEEARKLRKALEERDRLCEKRIEEEVERTRREFEKRLEEAQRVSRVAQTIVEALRKGVLRLVDSRGACRSIIVEPGQVLCRLDEKTLRVIYPEERGAEEEVVVSE